MKISREQYRHLLRERWGTNGATEAEIEEFLVTIMGQQSEMSVSDFIDLAFGVWRTRHEIGGCSCGAKFTTQEQLDEHADVCPLREQEREYVCLACRRTCTAVEGDELPRDDEHCSHQWEPIED